MTGEIGMLVRCGRGAPPAGPQEHAYRRATQRDPADAEALRRLGVLVSRRDLHESERLLARSVELRPDDPGIHNDLGVTLERLERFADAAECYRRAIALRPNFHQVWTNLANALLHGGDAARAVEAARRSIELCPTYAPAYNALGSAVLEVRDADAACSALRESVRLKTDFAEAHANLGTALLTLGEFQEGFAEREWRRKIEPIHRRAGRAWRGEDPFGHTILLYGEGGLGNVIQFARYVPLVADLGARVILECQPPLIPLLRSMPKVSQVIEPGQSAPAADMFCPLASLPAVLGTSLPTIPAKVPYLSVEATRAEQWRKILDAAGPASLRIGVCWHGDRRVPWLRGRSFDPRELLPIAQPPGVQLINLQHGIDPPSDVPMITLPGLEPHAMRLEDVAAAMHSLDLVITCDTAIAHLAGALGVRVWVALKHAACWRWMLDRDDSPWYPTMRLFRQEKPGDWFGVFARMAAESRRGDAESATGGPGKTAGA